MTKTYAVEFWSKPSEEATNDDKPHLTMCEDVASAVALEKRFHALGWSARALERFTRVDTILLTRR